MNDDTIICRCEDITLGRLRQLVADGYQSLDELRRIARCGMGQCQGKNCRPLIIQELSRLLGVSPGDLAQGTWRPPIEPIPLALLASAGKKYRVWGEDDEDGS